MRLSLHLFVMLLFWGIPAAAQVPAGEPVDTVLPAEENPVCLVADPMPTIAGTDVVGFRKWVLENLNFSGLRFSEELTVRMSVTMIVEPDGTLSEITVMNCADELIQAEVERVVAASPRWTPGEVEGKPVRVRCAFPLTLRFEKNVADDPACGQVGAMPVFDCDGTRSFPEWLWSRIPGELMPDSLCVTVRVVCSVVCSVECDGTLTDMRVRVSGVSEADEARLCEAVEAALADAPRCAPALSEGEPVCMKVVLRANRGETPFAEEEGVFLPVEQIPLFQGGDLNAFRFWVMMHLTYPMKCLEKGIEGKVVVEFFVEEDGSVTYHKTLQSPHLLLEQAIVRLIKKSPKWTPGTLEGEAVRVKFIFPVDFRIPQPQYYDPPRETSFGVPFGAPVR